MTSQQLGMFIKDLKDRIYGLNKTWKNRVVREDLCDRWVDFIPLTQTTYQASCYTVFRIA